MHVCEVYVGCVCMYASMCVCLCAKKWMSCYTYERKRKIWRSWLLPFWWLIWDHEVWKEVPLPTEPYHIWMLHLKYALASWCWASLYLHILSSSLPSSFHPSLCLFLSPSLPIPLFAFQQPMLFSGPEAFTCGLFHSKGCFFFNG